MRIRFLGTGASLGVPVVGCTCATCTSTDPKNRRLRTSLLVEVEGRRLLVDAGPDLRQQALQFWIEEIDGLILTHAHQDHTAGLDELRVYHFRRQGPVPCLLSQSTAQEVYTRFFYLLGKDPKLVFSELDSLRGAIDFVGVPLRYFTYQQQRMSVLGLRFGNFAYLTDIKEYPETIFEDLAGVEILVVSALRFTPSHMHFSVDDAIDFIHRVGPKKAYLTHIAHEIDHAEATDYLPPHIQVAYDGLLIEEL